MCIYSADVCNFFFAIRLAFFCTPLLKFSWSRRHGAKIRPIVLIRRDLELHSHDKSVRPHRVEIVGLGRTPQNGPMRASFQKKHILKKNVFWPVRGRKLVEIGSNRFILKVSASRIRFSGRKRPTMAKMGLICRRGRGPGRGGVLGGPGRGGDRPGRGPPGGVYL